MNASEIKKLIRPLLNTKYSDLMVYNSLQDNLYEIVKDENTPANLKNYDYIFYVENDHYVKFDKNLKFAKLTIKKDDVSKFTKRIETKYCEQEDIIELLKGEISIKEFFKGEVVFQYCLKKGIDLEPRIFFEFINNFKKGKINPIELPVYLYYYSSSDILMIPCEFNYTKPSKNNYLKFMWNSMMLNYYFRKFILLICENDKYNEELDGLLMEFQRDLKNKDREFEKFELSFDEICESIQTIGDEENSAYIDSKDEKFYSNCISRLVKIDSKESNTFLSNLYSTGDNITKKDELKSLDYALVGYQKGENLLTYRIGIYYKNIKNDPLNALKYLNIACMYDIDEAFITMSDIFYEGKIVKQDYNIALEYLNKVKERYLYRYLYYRKFSFNEVLVRYIDILKSKIDENIDTLENRRDILIYLFYTFKVFEEIIEHDIRFNIERFDEFNYKFYLFVSQLLVMYDYDRLPNFKKKEDVNFVDVTDFADTIFMNGFKQKMNVLLKNEGKYISLKIIPEFKSHNKQFVIPLVQYGYIYESFMVEFRIKCGNSYNGILVDSKHFMANNITYVESENGTILTIETEYGFHFDLLLDKIEIGIDKLGKLVDIKYPNVFKVYAKFDDQEYLCLAYTPNLEKGDKVKMEIEDKDDPLYNKIGYVTSSVCEYRSYQLEERNIALNFFIEKVKS